MRDLTSSGQKKLVETTTIGQPHSTHKQCRFLFDCDKAWLSEPDELFIVAALEYRSHHDLDIYHDHVNDTVAVYDL